MPLRKPLVMVAGQVQQLQAADTLDAPQSGGDIVQATNGEAGAITIGQVVYISAANTVKKAQANAAGTKDAIGFVRDASIAAAAVGAIQTDGLISGLAGLTAGARYFLDPAVLGGMTTVAPTTLGQYVVSLGVALSATEFNIDVEGSVLL